MRESRPIEINMSAIRVAGIGGLGMVAMAVVMAIALQPARWLLVGGIAGGALVALALVALRRRHPLGIEDGKLRMEKTEESNRQSSIVNRQ